MTLTVEAPASNKADRRGRLIIIVIMAAAFGPYTPIPGIRTEQAAVYLAAAVCVAASLNGAVKITRGALLVSSLLALQVTIAFVGGLFPPVNTSKYQVANFIAGMDNITLPLAVVVIVVTLASRGADVTRMLRAACGVLVVAMCLNAVIAAISAQVNINEFLSHWWDNQADVLEGGFHGAKTGRYVGLINLPAQAGELYGLALVAAIYLLRRSPARLTVAASLIITGGILAVSKTFLFIGLAVGGWQLFRWGIRRPARLLLAGVCIALGNTAISYFLQGAARGNSLLIYLDPDAGVHTVTAGRFGETSSLAPVASAVMTDSPLFGYGARSIKVALDNGWIEAMTVGGLVGVTAYTLMSVVLIWIWWRRHGTVDREWSQLSIGVILIANGAAMGMPGLTSNRIATVVWLLFSLLLLTPPPACPSPGPNGRAETPPLPRTPVTDRRPAYQKPAYQKYVMTSARPGAPLPPAPELLPFRDAPPPPPPPP